MIRKISVVAGIISRTSKEKGLELLMFRRSSGGVMNGLYEFPGGKLEPGEREPEALIRELQEELGMTVEMRDFFMQTLWRSGTHEILLKTYFVQVPHYDFKLSDHDDVQWFSNQTLPWDKIAKPDIPIIKALFGHPLEDV